MTSPIEPTSRRKPRKRRVGATVLVSLAVVIGALWALDNWARQQVADQVSEEVEQLLDLDDSEPVTVEIAGISVIAQILVGTLDEVKVDVDDVTIGELTGGVSLTATGVPVDLKKPVEKVQIEFAVTETSVTTIAHALSATAIDEVHFVDSEIQFASRFTVFGFPIDVGVAVEPFAAGGEVGFTPTSVTINGSRTSADELTESYGAAAESLLTTRSICVARWLPAALTVAGVEVRDDELVISIEAEKAILDDASLRTPGSCG